MPANPNPTLVDSAMSDLGNLVRHDIDSFELIQEAAKLTKNYCACPVGPKTIKAIMDADRWSSGELLSDIVKNPKVKEDEGTREFVAFCMLIDADKQKYTSKKNNLYTPKILGVRLFAMQPSYEIEVAVNWVKYKLDFILRNSKDYVGISWPVDEYDTPLQGELKRIGFKAIKMAEVPAEYIFNNGDERKLTRIIFTI
jgi:hypothetical protein